MTNNEIGWWDRLKPALGEPCGSCSANVRIDETSAPPVVEVLHDSTCPTLTPDGPFNALLVVEDEAGARTEVCRWRSRGRGEPS